MGYRFLVAAALSLGPATGLAQVVERNLPPAAPLGPDLTAPNAIPTEQDDSPIGPALSAIVLLGAADAVLPAAAPGIDTARVSRLGGEALEKRLSHFLGRPLSRRLIAEIEAEIARHYRARGFPFVALAAPAQEVTTGTLQIRVVEFHAGDIAVSGAARTPATFITDRVRQRSGAPIDARQLSQDLDWLNRNPFRTTEAIFSPGDALGQSDLTLAVAETRPWRVYAGAATSGSRSTGEARLFAGLQAAPFAAAPDAVLSYQFTASDDLFGGGVAGYRSHAGIFDLGIAPRQALEITLNHVVTNQAVAVFDIRQKTAEASFGWRGAAGAIGDLRVGVEARRSTRTVGFAGVPILDGSASIFQLYLGAERVLRDPLGHTILSATAHVSPGGIGASNSDASLSAYSDGRVTDAGYFYFDLSATRATRIGRMQLVTELIGRLTSGPLPDSGQIGIGGTGLVRGYLLDDGAYDEGIVARNTLQAPAISLGTASALTPYAFVDAGYARERVTGNRAKAVSAGAGAGLNLRRALSASAHIAHAFHDAPYTQNGDWRAEARISLSY